MKEIQVLHVLLEYDYPQVFVGRDRVDSRYVAMVVEEGNQGPVYLCTPISHFRCDELLGGKIDLRHIYEKPQVPEFFTCEPNDLTGFFAINAYASDEIPEQWLPEAGLFFNHADLVLNKAQELGSTIAYASLSVPESAKEARIRTRKLSEFLAIYQNVLKNLARATAKAYGKAIPKNEEPYDSDVFGFCPGSFTVQIRSAEQCDILGENKALVAAFIKLNEFLDLADQPDAAMAFLLGMKGHAATSLISLLSFISDNNCPFTNTWSTPGMSASSKSRIRVATAQNVIQRCKQREDLGIEVVELIGIVDSAKVSTGNWTIHADGDSFSGNIKEGSNLNLSGITVGMRYTFFCEEKIEVVQGTGREVRIISLVRYTEA
ncbi:DUF6575 domain-containing protein [Aquipseudomonas campi]